MTSHAIRNKLTQLGAENAALKAILEERDDMILSQAYRIKQLREAWDDLLEDLELHGMHDFAPYIKSKAKFKAIPDSTAELDAVMSELAEAYAELNKQRPAITAVFNRAVWDRAAMKELT